MRVVIDTQILIAGFSKNNKIFEILEAVRNNELELVISNEIISEYFEILHFFFGEKIIPELENFLFKSPSVYKVDPHYNFLIIKNDEDNNKFVDAAICSNSDYIITVDKHFKDAERSKFPIVNIISPEEFIEKHL